jgi:5'-nucleotidase
LVNAGRVTANPAVAALVETSRRRADSLTSRVVASIKLPLARTGDQYRLGSLIAEARRNVLRADVGLVGNASIRADLSAGPASYGQLFEVQPSGSSLVKVRVTGKQLKEIFEHAIGREGRPVAHAAGVTVKYNPRGRVGRRVQSIMLLPGRRFSDGGSYTLATDDLLSSGGEGYNMLVGLAAEPSGMSDLDGFVAYLRRLPQPVTVALRPGFVSSR